MTAPENSCWSAHEKVAVKQTGAELPSDFLTDVSEENVYRQPKTPIFNQVSAHIIRQTTYQWCSFRGEMFHTPTGKKHFLMEKNKNLTQLLSRFSAVSVWSCTSYSPVIASLWYLFVPAACWPACDSDSSWLLPLQDMPVFFGTFLRKILLMEVLPLKKNESNRVRTPLLWASFGHVAVKWAELGH